MPSGHGGTPVNPSTSRSVCISMRRLSILLAAVIIGVSCTASGPEPPVRPTGGSPTEKPADRSAGDSAPGSTDSPTDGLVVVWTRSGMPARAAQVVRQTPGVSQVATVTGGLVWGPGHGAYENFFETAYIEPGPIAHGLLGGARATFSETGASLLGRWTPRLGGLRTAPSVTVPDAAALGFEGISVGRAPQGWGRDFLLVRTTDRPRLRTAVSRLLEDAPFRIRSQLQTPLLRYADSVSPPMYFKKRFGAFSAVRVGGTLQIDPRWRDRNIVRVRLPLLGALTCHRKLVGPLREAMQEIERMGLASEIVDQAGCFSPRFIGSDPTSALSAHAWGAAIDINASQNPQGSEPTIDPGIVEIMESHRFNWGGRWLLPDGMHFEWRGLNGLTVG